MRSLARTAAELNRTPSSGPACSPARLAQIPAGRAGHAREVAAAVAYLAALDAGWTTGQIVQVDGGTLLGRG
ncbi:MAG TPA: SDR family oxidoreductase [Actinophytocola sp.]|jgi:3-oxoacyl-[acyl-carrier protein] reductase|nr:SDR family oxidoreductase [Actinophytocola sp.]